MFEVCTVHTVVTGVIWSWWGQFLLLIHSVHHYDGCNGSSVQYTCTVFFCVGTLLDNH